MGILGIYASSVLKVTNSYESIATVSLTGSQSTISFSSIPSTFKHLQLRYIARYDGSGTNENGFSMRFNSDSGSSYPYHLLYGTGSAAGAQGYSATTALWGGDVPQGGITANTFGAGVLDVLDYANTSKNKTLRSLSGYDANGSGLVALASGVWLNTAAINAITITFSGLNFVANSHFALYGIKG